MRVTIDLDSNNRFKLHWAMFKGFMQLGRYPDTIRDTNRGYHLIWYNIKASERKIYQLRKKIGDDLRRIDLDKSSNKRIKQVLFINKEVLYGKAIKIGRKRKFREFWLKKPSRKKRGKKNQLSLLDSSH